MQPPLSPVTASKLICLWYGTIRYSVFAFPVQCFFCSQTKAVKSASTESFFGKCENKTKHHTADRAKVMSIQRQADKDRLLTTW